MALMLRRSDCRWTLESPRRLVHALTLITVQAFGFFVIGPALLAPLLLGDADPFEAGSGALALCSILAVLDFAGVIAFGLLRVGRIRLSSLGWKTPLTLRVVLLGVAGGAASVALVFGIWLTMESGRTLGGFVHEIAGFSASQRVLFMLIGVQAAFVEETLFRGYLQPALIARWGPVGIALTAAIFALYHLNFRPVSLCSKFLFGLVFGALRGRDRSLFAPAIAHALLWNIVGTT